MSKYHDTHQEGKIESALRKFSSWVLNLEGSFAGALVKFFGTATAITGLIASPFVVMHTLNRKELQEKFSELDNGFAVVFNSVEDCTSQGFARPECEWSQKEALDTAKGFGTTLGYTSLQECMSKHTMCDQSYAHLIGPPVIAWQALEGSLIRRFRLLPSVPLYPGPTEGTAVRRDGKVFTLKP